MLHAALAMTLVPGMFVAAVGFRPAPSCWSSFATAPVCGSPSDGASLRQSASLLPMRMHADSPGEGHMDTGGEGRSFTGGPELAVLILRQRLQREWMAQRLRAPAGFLPYEDAAKWVQAQGYWESENEWRDWIELGELKCSYIPSDPAKYYQSRGAWKGWSDFLGTDVDKDFSLSPEDLVGRSILAMQESRRKLELEEAKKNRASKTAKVRMRRRQSTWTGWKKGSL